MKRVTKDDLLKAKRKREYLKAYAEADKESLTLPIDPKEIKRFAARLANRIKRISEKR